LQAKYCQLAYCHECTCLIKVSFGAYRVVFGNCT